MTDLNKIRELEAKLEKCRNALSEIQEFMHGENGELLDDSAANKKQVIIARQCYEEVFNGTSRKA